MDHEILISMLREHIKDERFIRLISHLLEAGYLEDWNWKATYSGAPQGGLCKALHNPPYAKRKAMQSNCKKSLKRRHCCPMYFA